MAVSCARQVEGLRNTGLDIDVMAFTETEPTMKFRIEARDGGLDYHFSRSVKFGPAARNVWRVVLDEHHQRPFTHVVGFGCNRPGHLAVTFGSWLACLTLVQVRGNDFDQDWFEPGRTFWVREALSRADRIGVAAPETGRRIKALFPDRDVRFLPNGVDSAAWDLLPSDVAEREEIRSHEPFAGRHIIGLFGELKYKKGVAYWLGALRDTDSIDRVGLLIVGKRVDNETEQILADPALAPPTLRYPFSGQGRLPGLYSACDFVAIPSLYEGMPNVLLEAMAAGVIPIVSDAGAMADVVRDGETGFVFPAGNRAAAAEATARALSLEAEEQAAMKDRIRAHVAENFTVDREIRNLIDILQTNNKFI